MACHIAQGASSVINPATPLEGLVIGVIRPFRSWTKEKIPMEIRRNGRRACRTSHTLRPDRAIAPDMHLSNVADCAGLDHLDSAAQTRLGAALITHLRGDFVLPGGVPHQTRFVDRMS